MDLTPRCLIPASFRPRICGKPRLLHLAQISQNLSQIQAQKEEQYLLLRHLLLTTLRFHFLIICQYSASGSDVTGNKTISKLQMGTQLSFLYFVNILDQGGRGSNPSCLNDVLQGSIGLDFSYLEFTKAGPVVINVIEKLPSSSSDPRFPHQSVNN